ncbi:MAG: glycosyltransferase family 4 protein [Gemmatimonadetes bacterium]|nr:glycosyltransferase family 4 protein [Gemmatimonadota bacterium]
MRILVVNKFYWPKGGSERVLFDLAEGYERAGHEVVPFAMASPENRPSRWSGYFVPEVDYARAAGLGRLRAAANVVWSREAERRLTELVAAAKPDVAHLHNFHHQLSPSVVDALRKAGVPAVHTLHDYKVLCPNYLMYVDGAPCDRCGHGSYGHAVRHRCLHGSIAASAVAMMEMTFHRWRGTLARGIAAFVAPSRFLRDKCIEFGFPPDRVRWVPNGVVSPPTSASPAAGRGFLYAGRLSPEKGVMTAIDAVARNDRLQLTIAGTGPAEPELRRHAARVAPGRVTFRGFVSRDEVEALARESRALVVPSRWWENAPLSVLEGLAVGIPIVATSLGGLPELVRPEETGLLVPPGDPAALAEALVRLEEDPELAARLGRGGQALIERDYRLTTQVERMLDLLDEVRVKGISCAY